jgi:hypothetical protein
MMTALFLAILSLAPEDRDVLLADTQGNQALWSEMLGTLEGVELECLEYLFTTIPRLDRLEMTDEMLMDHLMGALEYRDALYDSIPDDVFLPCLLGYRISEEPVTAYRTPLAVYWEARLDSTVYDPDSIARFVASELSSMAVRKPDFMGGIAAPLDVAASGGGTPVELRVLLGSSLRSLGIPVRPVMGWFQGPHGREAGWLQYWDGAGWASLPLASDSIPADLAGLSMAIGGEEDITSTLVPSGTLRILPADSTGLEVITGILIEAPGWLIALDWLEMDPYSQTDLTLGEGSYLAQIAERLPNGTVRLWTERVAISAGDITVVDSAVLMDIPVQ